jgi:hypothetical protein
MVVIEDIKHAIVFNDLGAKVEQIDVSTSLPAGYTLNYLYTPQSGYAYFKVDMRFGPMANRIIEVTVEADKTLEYNAIDAGLGFSSESARNIVKNVIYNSALIKIKNTDIVAHDIDFVERGVLIRKEMIPELMERLKEVSLSETTIKKLAKEIAKELQPIKTR